MICAFVPFRNIRVGMCVVGTNARHTYDDVAFRDSLATVDSLTSGCLDDRAWLRFEGIKMLSRFIRDTYRLLAGRDTVTSEDCRSRFDRELARSAASRFSRGNVAIQLDAFVTTADLERERREVAKIVFRN